MLMLWFAAIGTVELRCEWTGTGVDVVGDTYEEIAGSCLECEGCVGVEASSPVQCVNKCSSMQTCWYSTWEETGCVLLSDCHAWGGNGTSWSKNLVGYKAQDAQCKEGEPQANANSIFQCSGICATTHGCSSFTWEANSSTPCTLVSDCVPTSTRDQGLVRYEKQSVSHDTHSADTAWEDSHAYCKKNHSRLCSMAEICSELGNTSFDGSRWAPVGSTHNGWVQVGEKNTCGGIQVFDQAGWGPDSFYEDVFCCKSTDCRVPGSVGGQENTEHASDKASCWSLCSSNPQCAFYTYDPVAGLCNMTYNSSTMPYTPHSSAMTSPLHCELSRECRYVTEAPYTLVPLVPTVPSPPIPATPAPTNSKDEGIPLLPLIIAAPVVALVLVLVLVAWKVRPTTAGMVSGKTRKSISDLVQDNISGRGSVIEMEPRGSRRGTGVSPTIQILTPSGKKLHEVDRDRMQPGGELSLLHPPPTPVFGDQEEGKKQVPSPAAGFVGHTEASPKRKKRTHSRSRDKHDGKIEDNQSTFT